MVRTVVRGAVVAMMMAEAGGGHGNALLALHTVARFGSPRLVCDRLLRLLSIVDGP